MAVLAAVCKITTNCQLPLPVSQEVGLVRGFSVRGLVDLRLEPTIIETNSLSSLSLMTYSPRSSVELILPLD